MNTKHTPGEWKATSTGNIYGLVNGEWIVVAVASDMPCDDFAAERGMDMERANARLIAAAPELLAALEILLTRAESLDQSATHDGLQNIDALLLARRVIAKAKGEA